MVDARVAVQSGPWSGLALMSGYEGLGAIKPRDMARESASGCSSSAVTLSYHGCDKS